jgi:hypothetical protein
MRRSSGSPRSTQDLIAGGLSWQETLDNGSDGRRHVEAAIDNHLGEKSPMLRLVWKGLVGGGPRRSRPIWKLKRAVLEPLKPSYSHSKPLPYTLPLPHVVERAPLYSTVERPHHSRGAWRSWTARV